MNKQELIEKIKALKPYEPDLYEYDSEELKRFEEGFSDAKIYAELAVKELDEPEKPIVPQYVAEWYENNNYDFEYNLYRLCALYTERKLFKELDKWFDNDNNRPIETLVVMHKFGYEIEKERLYTARLKLISVKKYSYINREKDEKELFISDSDGLTDVYQTHFTQAVS